VAREHPDPDMREEAVEHLGKFGNAQARQVVRESKRDEE
jgi:hypothetical protein